MKKILILMTLMFSSFLLAQSPNWTSVKETSINVSNA